jgi:hypothetical protein
VRGRCLNDIREVGENTAHCGSNVSRCSLWPLLASSRSSLLKNPPAARTSRSANIVQINRRLQLPAACSRDRSRGWWCQRFPEESQYSDRRLQRGPVSR